MFEKKHTQCFYCQPSKVNVVCCDVISSVKGCQNTSLAVPLATRLAQLISMYEEKHFDLILMYTMHSLHEEESCVWLA